MGPYQQGGRYGWTVVDALPEIWGQPWDKLSQNMIRALRPSMIREVWGGTKMDHVVWRVTVWLEGSEEKPFIEKIQQEVEVDLEGVEHGHDLGIKLQERAPRRKA